jgi:hypothetical protein
MPEARLQSTLRTSVRLIPHLEPLRIEPPAEALAGTHVQDAAG